MRWIVAFDAAFEHEFDELPEFVQDELLAQAALPERFGPELGRPHVDTLKGSVHANMKELRFAAGKGIWRVAFAFDSERKAVLLVGGDKSGVNQMRFYRKLVLRADKRFAAHLERLKSKAGRRV
jgi:hypothetical protein